MGCRLFLALVFDEAYGLAQVYVHRIDVLGYGHIFFGMQHIRTEASCAHGDRLPFILSKGLRELEEFEGFFEGDGGYALSFVELGKAWAFSFACHTYLHHWAKATYLDADRFACARFFSQDSLADLVLVLLLQGGFDEWFELCVEVLHHLVPVFASVGYLVKLFLHVGCEVVVDDLRE